MQFKNFRKLQGNLLHFLLTTFRKKSQSVILGIKAAMRYRTKT